MIFEGAKIRKIGLQLRKKDCNEKNLHKNVTFVGLKLVIMKKCFPFLMALILLASCNNKEIDLTTTFEKSNYLETDSYDGTIAYAKLLAKHWNYCNGARHSFIDY